VEGLVGQVDEVAEVPVRRLPRQPAEDPHVVEEEHVVLLEPAPEHVRVELAGRDPGHGGVGQLGLDAGPAEGLEVGGDRHGSDM
jgi:hypothetical protein